MENKTALVTGACVNTGVAIVEKFAPVTHSMVLEDIIRGYEESAAENLDWANL